MSEMLVDIEGQGRVCIYVLKCFTIYKNENFSDRGFIYVNNIYIVDFFLT